MGQEGLSLPETAKDLVAHLKRLTEERGKYPKAPRRLALSPRQRAAVLEKTDRRCHLCGGAISPDEKFAADHVLAHAAGGQHKVANYLAAHSFCNGTRWFYSSEEFQWILRMGVWARKQMEDRTVVGRQMLAAFLEYEKAVRRRRKGGASGMIGDSFSQILLVCDGSVTHNPGLAAFAASFRPTRKDRKLYELLALVDAIRDGQARERQIAQRERSSRLRSPN